MVVPLSPAHDDAKRTESDDAPPTSGGAPAVFSSLGLHEVLVRALHRAGYRTPTPIQAQAVPPGLAGRDVLGCARTGTGKTAAFLLPVLQHLMTSAARREERRSPRALVLAPTRELAAQIAESTSTYGRESGLRHAVVFGGVSDRPQAEALRRGVDILIATPGRLLDLMEQGVVRLDRVEMLVLDEFDRMLDQGFLPAIRRILRAVPASRQTLLFSATSPSEVEREVGRIMRDPVRVSVSRESATPDRIDQAVWFVDQAGKREALEHILGDPAITRALVFTRTKHGANRVATHLSRAGIEADAIHGNKSQNARTRALGRFRDGEVRVLVATDVAARGIDVDEISHVINFDLPIDPDSYVHRIGRTARAGRDGAAYSLCSHDERGALSRIERRIGCRLQTRNDVPAPRLRLRSAGPHPPLRGGRSR